MTSKLIAISLPEGFITLLDAEATIRYESRSEYIKQAVIARMKADGVDITAEPRTREEVERKRLADFLASYNFGEIDSDLDDGESEERETF